MMSVHDFVSKTLDQLRSATVTNTEVAFSLVVHDGTKVSGKDTKGVWVESAQVSFTAITPAKKGPPA